MPLKLHVSINKKIGLPEYSSAGAACGIELELDQSLLMADPDGLQARVRQAYAACSQAVNEELERQKVKKIFQGVAQRPGKPLWFGVSGRRTPVFALPGNPVAAYTCLHRYVLPALGRASGLTAAAPRLVALAAPVTFKPKLAYLLPVKLQSGPRAEALALPDPSNTSGDFAGLVETDGFVELPGEQTDFPAGTVAPFWAWV